MKPSRRRKKSPNRKGPGRPPTGKHPLISFRLPQALINEIEVWATVRGLTRSAGLRTLIDRALSDNRRFEF